MFNLTYTLAEIPKIAQQVLPIILKQQLVIFSGDMGVGKTSLIRELLKILGFADFLGSPTFALIHSYRNTEYLVHHMDFYRLNGVQELANLDLEHYLLGARCWIEWGEKFEEYLQIAYGQMNFSYVDELRRNCTYVNRDFIA